MIAAAVFDMDGLLLDTERLFYDTFVTACNEQGWDGPWEVFLRSVGRARENIVPMLRDEMGPDFPAETVVERSYVLAEEMLRNDGPPLKAGATEALEAISARGLRAVVATSTDTADARRYLEHTGLLHRFEAVVGGDQVERGKPEPDIFLAAARTLGVDPTSILVFEDSDLGVRAAAAAGMRVVMIPDLIEPTEELRRLAFAVVPSLEAAARGLDVLVGTA